MLIARRVFNALEDINYADSRRAKLHPLRIMAAHTGVEKQGPASRQILHQIVFINLPSFYLLESAFSRLQKNLCIGRFYEIIIKAGGPAFQKTKDVHIAGEGMDYGDLVIFRICLQKIDPLIRELKVQDIP